MALLVGILFALSALICWGVGDFLIQRSARKFGDWETLFVITAFGAIILTPLVYGDVTQLAMAEDNTSFFVLLSVSAILMVAALLDFEALKKGKIAIVEPILALEVPVAAIMAFALINEGLGMLEIFLISTLMIGIALISLKSHHLKRRIWLEKGAILAAIGALFMGTSNFLVGFASRITNPLLTNWFINVFIAMICFYYIMTNKRIGKLVSDFKANTKLLLTVSTFDNLAWITFACAASLIPIAIAVAISESYIALAALLGLLINREILMKHQKAGLIAALSSAVLLSMVAA
jgi:drug/metabolite transporter (DMT)-like permease